MSFFAELKRRNVVRVGIAYVVAAWLLLQLTEVLSELLDLPDVAGRFVVLLLIVGFVPALIFAWAFEMTPEGIKREKDVDRSRSVASQTGRKLDFAIIGMLVLVAGYFIWESRFAERDPIKGSEPFSRGGSAELASADSEKRGLTPGGERGLTPGPAARSGPQAGGERGGGRSERTSIAVLPFANRSNQDDDLFFTDGIHDDLLTQLAKMDDLQVISRTSVMEYRETTKKIPEIAAELGVSTILEGGVQRAGKRIRINAQLIDVTTDTHLWSETFDREMSVENIFDIQSEITRHIVEAVRGELSPEEQQALEDLPTTNLEAYEAFLRARAATNLADYGRDKYIEAEPWARRATDLDPEFAQAWALLAEIHGQAIWIGYDGSAERHEWAREALAKAVALAPGDPAVMAAQADQLYRLENDYDGAYALYRQARVKAPNDARIVLFQAITERRLGLWEESVSTFEQAHELDPANVFIVTQWADTLWRMRAFERLEPWLAEWLVRYPNSRDLQGIRVLQLMHQHGDLHKARELFDLIPPSSNAIYFEAANDLLRWQRDYEAWRALWEMPELNTISFRLGDEKNLRVGISWLLSGNPERGQEHLQAFIEQVNSQELESLRDRAARHANLAIAHGWLGANEKANVHAEQAVTLFPIADDALIGMGHHRVRTWVLAKTGEQELAIQRLAEQRDRPEGYTSWELALDPNWDFLRDDPAFQALVGGKRDRERRP